MGPFHLLCSPDAFPITPSVPLPQKHAMTKRAFAVIIQPPASGVPAQLWRILDGVLLGPFTRGLLVLLPVGLVGVCNLGHQRVVGVGVGQHGADRQKNY